MIENLWIISKGGLPYFELRPAKSGTEKVLLSGFLTAVESFVREATDNEIESINLSKKRITYSIDKDLIFVICTDEDANQLMINRFVEVVKKEFWKKYRKEISTDLIDYAVFDSFSEVVEKMISETDFILHCDTCGKLIPDEFISLSEGNERYYYCCQSCYTEGLRNHSKSSSMIAGSFLMCQKCGYTKPVPVHCDTPMHVEIIDEEPKLVCHMGPSCAVQDVPSHCGVGMRLILTTS